MCYNGRVDPNKIQRLLRAYRAVKTAGRVRRGYEKLEVVMDEANGNTNMLLDVAEFAERVREERVRPEDIRQGGRKIVNSLPRVYRAVARHIQKRGAEQDAKA